jgi:hypothetical protein
MLQSQSPFRARAKKSVELTIAIVPAGMSFPAVWQELDNALGRQQSFDQLNSVPSIHAMTASMARQS